MLDPVLTEAQPLSWALLFLFLVLLVFAIKNYLWDVQDLAYSNNPTKFISTSNMIKGNLPGINTFTPGKYQEKSCPDYVK